MNELELRDIHLPQTSLWWPPAPGWWLLLALLLLLGLVVIWLIWRRHHQPLPKLSLRELEIIRRARADGQSENATINAVARLLRRTLISYYGRETQAATTGAAWTEQLQRLAPRRGFSERQLRLLSYDRYQANPDCDVDGLLQACESWIRNLPRKVPRVSV